MLKTPIVLLAASALLSSCGSDITPEEEASVQTAVEFAKEKTEHTSPTQTLEQARNIKVLPVQRERLVDVFHLQNVPSKRSLTSSQEGVVDHTEAWIMPNGLTLRAYNYKVLTKQQYFNTLSLINNDQASSPEQPFFRFFDIKDSSGKTIYASLEQKDVSPGSKP